MKAKHIFFIFWLFALNTSQAAKITVRISNPNMVEVKNMPVVINLNKYKTIDTQNRQKLAVFIDQEQISSQLDDLNGDSIPDELIFLTYMPAKGNKNVIIKTISNDKRKSFPAEVYADLILKRPDGSWNFVKEVSSTKNDMYNKLHHHGVAFESSLIAYRIYFDNKSTIDVYGKKKQRLELSETEWYPTDSQANDGYGDDILRVFGSVGVGSVKGWDGNKAVHIDKFGQRTQRIVATGNLRTVVESTVTGWQYEGKEIDLQVRYIMYARHRDVLCEISANKDIDYLATGVQTIANGPVYTNHKNLVGSWGTDFPVTDTIKYDKQTCGLGVYIPQQLHGTYTTDGLNNLYLLPYKKGTILRFYLTAAAAKEEKKQFQSSSDFFTYLKDWSNSLEDILIK